jgi:hypothetical protein
MGMMRKLTSVSTLGMVPYRDKDERQLHVAKQTRKAAKQTRNATRVAAVATVVTAYDQRKAIRADQVMSAPAPMPAIAASPVPPQWLPDPYDPSCVTWWDGQQWRPETKQPR